MTNSKWVKVSIAVLMLTGLLAFQAQAQEGEERPQAHIMQVLSGLRLTGQNTSALPYAGIPQTRLEDGGFLLGDPNAPVVVIEFADFLCPHCQDYEETTERFIQTYVVTGQAAFEYRMVPIVNEILSPLSAQAAECAGEQGAFWPGRQLLFQLAADQQIDENVALLTANRLGLDAAAMQACMETARQFLADAQLAGQMGVTGTPAMMVRVDGSRPQWISIQGQVLDRGGLPYEVLEQVVLSVQRQNSGG